MDQEKTELILGAYLARLSEMDDLMTNDESAKWRAVAHFQETWNAGGPFTERYAGAIQEAGDLLDPGHKRTTDGVAFLLRYPQEQFFAEQCFEWLFSADDGDLGARSNRIAEFTVQMQGQIEKHSRQYRSLPLTRETALSFLNLARPAENYFFEKDEANFFAACVDYPADFSGGLDLPTYYAMCEELRAIVVSDAKLMRQNELRGIKNGVSELDDQSHLLVYDIIHCNYKYGLMPGRKPGKISRAETSQRLSRHEEKEELDRKIMMASVKLKRLQGEEEKTVPLRNGTTVIHRAYGAGRVAECTMTDIAVDFGTDTKKFRFPDAFDRGFLTLGDTAAMDDCAEVMRRREERRRLELDLKRMQQKRSRM